MKRIRLMMLAIFALLALGAVSSTAAMAESDGPPAILVLEGTVTGLEFKGPDEGENGKAKTALSTLNKKSIEGEGIGATLSECVTLEGKEKDSNLCHKGSIDFLKTKQGAVNCASESEKEGKITKDPAETILVLVDAHLADEKSTGGVLQPLLILEVLGINKEAELKINCGGVKELVKGRIGCLVLPGLKEIVAGEKIEVLCKTKESGDQETGTCEETKVLCDELAKKPLEGNLGAGFEMAAQTAHINLTANKNVFIDD